VTTSRNHGVRQTSGPLLAFLDADDVWLPGKLTNQVSIFGQHPGLAMVAEANRYWYSWNDPKLEDTLIPVGALQTGGQIIPVPFVADRVFDPMQLMSHLYPLGNGAAPCPSGLMVAKEAFTKVGGFEESFIRENQLYEDQVFLSKIYLEHKVYISSVCNNLYRQRPESCVKWVTANGHYHKVRQHYLQWLTDYLNAREINDTALNRLVRKALMPYHRPLYHFLINEMPQKIKRRSQNLFFSFSQ
jgi:glycosyltransferase involved in cell wall biosynthesis